jgi:hypothetical protein
MDIDNGTRGATTPWHGPAHYRDLGRLLCEAVAAGLIGSLALALAVLIATTTARASDAGTAPSGGSAAAESVNEAASVGAHP